MSFVDWLRAATPNFLLEWNRKRKKNRRKQQLINTSTSGKSLTEASLMADFKTIGLKRGDDVLVHSSLSRIGHLVDGPKTFVDALLKTIGEEGTLLMPTSPNNVFQLDYIQTATVFDVLNTPSKTGAITEYFRKLPSAVRSLHPTEPVSGIGPKAEFYTKDHFNQPTPYNQHSPFYKISEQGGKILYVGVGLSMAGTNLHTLEDAVQFKYPVYHPDFFEIKLIDANGNQHQVKTKVHNPVYSKKRKCDDLIPYFEAEKALFRAKVGHADTLVVDAKRFFDAMVEGYEKSGITMYTPKGN